MGKCRTVLCFDGDVDSEYFSAVLCFVFHFLGDCGKYFVRNQTGTEPGEEIQFVTDESMLQKNDSFRRKAPKTCKTYFSYKNIS